MALRPRLRGHLLTQFERLRIDHYAVKVRCRLHRHIAPPHAARPLPAVPMASHSSGRSEEGALVLICPTSTFECFTDEVDRSGRPATSAKSLRFGKPGKFPACRVFRNIPLGQAGGGLRFAYLASGSGRIWKCTTFGEFSLPPSMWNGVRLPVFDHTPRPFQPALGSSMRPSRPLAQKPIG